MLPLSKKIYNQSPNEVSSVDNPFKSKLIQILNRRRLLKMISLKHISATSEFKLEKTFFNHQLCLRIDYFLKTICESQLVINQFFYRALKDIVFHDF